MVFSSVRTTQTPYFSLYRSSTSPGLYDSGKPALKTVGGSKRTLGNINRMVAVRPAMLAAVKAVQATASQLNSLRLTVSLSALPLAAARLGGAAGPAAAATGAVLCLSFGVM